MVVDLHLVTIVDGHPGLARLDGNAYEDTGVVVFVAHLVHNPDDTVAYRACSPIEQAHTAVGSHESVLNDHLARAHVLPTSEVLAVKELDPVAERRANRLQGERFVSQPTSGESTDKANCL